MKKFNILFLLLMSALLFAQPSSGAPAPTKDAVNVISIYGDTYTSIVTNFNPNWGQSGTVNDAYSAGADNVLAYNNFNYQGTYTTTTDASTMEYLHIDVWTSDATNLKVSPINNGTGAAEFLVDVPLVSGGWSSVDLPKSAFTGMTWDSIFQMKFDAQAGTTPCNIYLDNIYFWKNPTVAGSDATLSDLKVDGTTISGFSAGVNTYQYPVASPTPVPQITTATTTDTSATTSITQATAVPGSATVVVTSANGNETKTYTVNYIVQGVPSTDAPDPTVPTNRVKSIFSDAYTDITVNEWGPNWGPPSARITDTTINSNPTKLMNVEAGQVFAGIDFASQKFDATNFEGLHIDVWVADPMLTGQTFNIKLSNHDGAGETSAIQYNPTLTPGTWTSLDIPLADFIAASTPDNLSRNNIAQIVISAARADNSQPVQFYLDNIYFYSSTPLGVADVAINEKRVTVYPNPVSTGETLYVNNAQTVEVYNMVGQLLETHKGNEFNTKGLKSGIYVLKITDKNLNTTSTKLIVK